MKELAVACKGVTKRYGNSRALQEFSAALPMHGVTGVLGPNGAGKSTLFRVIMGLTRPDSGTVKVLGGVPGWQANAAISYLPDKAQWYPQHTVAQAFDWAEKLLPGFGRARAEGLADFMKLLPTATVAGMSRGQEARLMLTVCLARDVPLVILDEPFSGIDLVSRERIISAIIDNLAERKQTVLLSTHEIREVESLLDYAIFMDEGKAVLAGDADALRRKRGSMEDVYRSLYN